MAELPEITPIAVPAVTHLVQPAPPWILGIAVPILPLAATSSSVPFVPATEARRLARDLVAGKQTAVLTDLKNMSPTDRRAIEQALVGALTDRRQKAQGPLLRRMIRFVDNPPVTPPAPQPIGRTSSGTLSATVALADGTATLHTNVTLGPSAFRTEATSDAYSLTYTSRPGTQKADTKRWLQFIWRMVVVEFERPAGSAPLRPKPLQMRLDKLDVPYFLTTDEAKPVWSVDSAARATAFYDENFAPMARTRSTLVMYDAPSAVPNDQVVLYGLFNNLLTPTGERLERRPESVVAYFRAKTYLVDGMDVLCRADISLKWRFRDPDPHGPATFAVLVSELKKTTVLEPDSRLALVRQFPTFDYLPGDFGVPRPAASFDLISPVEPASTRFDSSLSNLDRLKEAATLAHPELIDHVIAPPGKSIGQPKSAPIAGSVDVQPGLNYFPGTLSGAGTAAGEAGYLDGTVYEPKGVPANRTGVVPSVAITLAALAFEYGSPHTKPRRKDFAIATLRHEMLHAAHYELAILWLLKWRADFTNEPFPTWLNRQLGNSVILPVDYAVVSTYLGTRGKNATEALAYIEGVVTGLPWLESPSITDLDDEFLWPASINELKCAGEFYNGLGLDDAKVMPAVIERVRNVACGSLSQVQRETAANWIKALRKPGILDPTGSHHATVAAVQGYFGPLDAFLDELLKQFQQPCPP